MAGLPTGNVGCPSGGGGPPPRGPGGAHGPARRGTPRGGVCQAAEASQSRRAYGCGGLHRGAAALGGLGRGRGPGLAGGVLVGWAPRGRGGRGGRGVAADQPGGPGTGGGPGSATRGQGPQTGGRGRSRPR